MFCLIGFQNDADWNFNHLLDDSLDDNRYFNLLFNNYWNFNDLFHNHRHLNDFFLNNRDFDNFLFNDGNFFDLDNRNLDFIIDLNRNLNCFLYDSFLNNGSLNVDGFFEMLKRTILFWKINFPRLINCLFDFFVFFFWLCSMLSLICRLSAHSEIDQSFNIRI